MSDNEFPAEWAIKEALRRSFEGLNLPLLESKLTKEYILINESEPFSRIILLHAKTIEKYEKPPIDPIVLEARKICTEYSDKLVDYMDGHLDHSNLMRVIISAIKRGMEIAST